LLGSGGSALGGFGGLGGMGPDASTDAGSDAGMDGSMPISTDSSVPPTVSDAAIFDAAAPGAGGSVFDGAAAGGETATGGAPGFGGAAEGGSDITGGTSGNSSGHKSRSNGNPFGVDVEGGGCACELERADSRTPNRLSITLALVAASIIRRRRTKRFPGA
jgi:hypothetical protein